MHDGRPIAASQPVSSMPPDLNNQQTSGDNSNQNQNKQSLCNICKQSTSTSLLEVTSLQCCMCSEHFHGNCLKISKPTIDFLYVVIEVGGWCCPACRLARSSLKINPKKLLQLIWIASIIISRRSMNKSNLSTQISPDVRLSNLLIIILLTLQHLSCHSILPLAMVDQTIPDQSIQDPVQHQQRHPLLQMTIHSTRNSALLCSQQCIQNSRRFRKDLITL